MHIYHLQRWQHAHRYHAEQSSGERRTWYVMGLTLVTMAVEIVAGLAYGSMALLADGWHMSTHVAAFAITLFAYRYARRHADDSRYSFGTGKVGALGGFASAVALAVVALVMAIESLQRMVAGSTIRFDQAIFVAIAGLIVNLVSALLLQGHDHGHAHAHEYEHAHHAQAHEHEHHDHNLRAAYLHVLADAMTSVLAIVALLTARSLGWLWLDPLMGMVGAIIITRWAFGLLRQTSADLLDASPDPAIVAAMRAAIEADADNRVADLHVWRVGANHLGAIVSIVTHYAREVEHYRALLSPFDLAHLTIEVNACTEEPCLLPDGRPALNTA